MVASIAAVAIAKNEEDRIHAWCANLVEADAMFIYDTGSEDGTHDAAVEESISVFYDAPNQQNFRFDRARNDLLRLVQEAASFDYVFWVDLDEVVERGWREKFDYAIERYGEQEIFSTVRVWGSLAYDRADHPQVVPILGMASAGTRGADLQGPPGVLACTDRHPGRPLPRPDQRSQPVPAADEAGCGGGSQPTPRSPSGTPVSSCTTATTARRWLGSGSFSRCPTPG